MVDSPFDLLARQVEGLRKEYETLNGELPRLRENKKIASAELLEVNKQVVVAQEKLDELNETIKTNTETYNEWQRAQLAKLKTAQNKRDQQFEQQKDKFAHETRAKKALLGEAWKVIKRSENALKESQEKLTRGRAEVSAQMRINDKRAAALIVSEEEAAKEKSTNTQESSRLATNSIELDRREQKIHAEEEAILQLKTAATIEREAARTLLSQTKESIEVNDTKEKGLDIRAKVLDQKERELKAKEVALNDRQNVLVANSH